MINNTWFPLEPRGGLTSYDFYKDNRNISKACRIEKNGITDVTSDYAKFGYVLVRVIGNEMPEMNATVCIFSKFLPLSDPKTYKGPILTTCDKTDEFGIYLGKLGKGIYDIEVLHFQEPLKCYIGKLENITINPYKTTNVIINLKDENPLSCFLLMINNWNILHSTHFSFCNSLNN
jgi:hypothetical protein